jgi:hypothetical protein
MHSPDTNIKNSPANTPATDGSTAPIKKMDVDANIKAGDKKSKPPAMPFDPGFSKTPGAPVAADHMKVNPAAPGGGKWEPTTTAPGMSEARAPSPVIKPTDGNVARK